MGKPYSHQYLNAKDSQCGTMMCGACGKLITSGEYRAYKREKNYDWKFITHHRECCQNDPAWEKVDAKRDANAKRSVDLLKDAIKFRDKWKIDDLDDLIHYLSPQELL